MRYRVQHLPRRDRRIQKLGTQRPQGVVDGIDDRCGWRDSPALAEPFDAEFGMRRERLHVLDARRGYLGRPRQQIIRECRSERLSRRIERHFLVKRRSDPLRIAAENLSVDDHRIDQLAAVLNDHVIENFDGADFRIDGDQGGMRGVAERAAVRRGPIPDRRFQSAHVDVAGQVLRL